MARVTRTASGSLIRRAEIVDTLRPSAQHVPGSDELVNPRARGPVNQTYGARLRPAISGSNVLSPPAVGSDAVIPAVANVADEIVP